MDARELEPELDPLAESHFAEQRRKMVSFQLADRGIHDPRVLAAMLEVPRHRFVPSHSRSEAYDDCPVAIGFGQTISQPLTVAWMAQALHLHGEERVLEVGTGSGYGAAILSRLAQVVHTVERIPQLAARAKRQLKMLGYDHVHVHTDDGTLGLPAEAPFDAIIVTAGGEVLPPPYVEQLAEGGKILIPLGKQNTGQQMVRYSLHTGKLVEEHLGFFAFVPLLGKFGTESTAASSAD